MFTIVFICLFLFTCVYLCLDLFTRVYSYSLVFTYVYTEMDKMEKAASSEIDNFDIWEKDQQEALTLICEKNHQEAFVGWKRSDCFVHTLQLVVKVIETAPAYSRTVVCIGYCEESKQVMLSNRVPDTASWKEASKNCQTRGICYF